VGTVGWVLSSGSESESEVDEADDRGGRGEKMVASSFGVGDRVRMVW